MNKPPEHRKSIVTQTVSRVSVVFLTAIAILILAFTWFIATYMRNSIIRTRQAQVDTVSGIVESRMDDMVGPVISLAEFSPAVRMVSGYYQNYSPEWMTAVRSLDTFLQNVHLFSSYILDIDLLGEDSRVVYTMNEMLKKNITYRQEDWFADALKKNTTLKYAPPHGSDHLYETTVSPTFSVIYPIIRESREIGYVLMEVDLLQLGDFLREEIEEGTKYSLLDDEGQVIYCTDSRNSNLSDPHQGFSFSHTLRANGWTILLTCEKSIILGPVYRLIALIALLAVGTLFLILFILQASARQMGKPLDVLVERINTYDGSGPRDTLLYEDAPKEVAVIGERFEHMAGKMNELIQDVYLAKLSQKEAEMDALVNQINPHFLYNVLQLIETKAVLADNREIEDMIQALSQMMRYTMERGKDRVPVREELDYIRSYLMFYLARFPGMFTYEINCPEAQQDILILKFILQPFVENSIKYAFDRSRQDGRLVISAEEDGKDLIFTIWDNGKGMTGERLETIRSRLSEAGSIAFPDEGRTGIGMVNTNERIRLIYGSGYGIAIDSEEMNYTCVKIRVPAERRNDFRDV